MLDNPLFNEYSCTKKGVKRMARPVDPESQFRVKIHNNGGYTYASTQPPYTDLETGK